MKRPGWGTTIGILMIIFAGCTAKDSLQSISMPAVLESSPEIIEEAFRQEGVSQDSIDALLQRIDSLKTSASNIDSLYSEEDVEGMSSNNSIEKFVLRNLGDVFNMSEYTKTWMIRFGYIGLFVALIYLLGGVFLLVVKPFSIKFAYAALGVSIVYMIAQIAVIAPSAGDLISFGMYAEGGVSILIDIILILVIFSSDKYVYEEAAA